MGLKRVQHFLTIQLEYICYLPRLLLVIHKYNGSDFLPFKNSDTCKPFSEIFLISGVDGVSHPPLDAPEIVILGGGPILYRSTWTSTRRIGDYVARW